MAETRWTTPASNGDAQVEADGTLTGENSFHRGDDSAFTAHRWWRFSSL
jgi:hypothetical protein